MNGTTGSWDASPVIVRRERRRERAHRLVRRSTMIMPANVPPFVDKAYMREADAILLDLEDSIPESEKDAAGEAARAAIPSVGRGGSDVLVRVNRPYELLVRDLDA